MTVDFDYEQLVADFNHSLNTQLRGHGSENRYLETWVPDEDPIKGILNMAESALSAGCDELRIVFSGTLIGDEARRTLVAAINQIAHGTLSENSDRCNLVIRASQATP